MAEALSEANQYCGDQQKPFSLVKSSEAQPPFVLGNFPRAEVHFRCTDQTKISVPVEACLTRFSERAPDAIARAKCLNDVDRIYAQTAPFPDLIHLRMAKRLELAERYAAGKFTRAQMGLEFAQLNSSLAAEHQRRANNNQSVAAQQQAASAATIGAINAGAPRSCTRIGNTVNCF